MNKISKKDVTSIAEYLKIKMKKYQINRVIELYPSYQKRDPTARWDLVIEEVIEEVVNRNV